ncbi:MAG: hypothetical protein ACK4FA_01815 [Candidatus Paceibacteria bacterium]
MEKDPFKKQNPAFDKDKIEEIEFLKDLDKESAHLEDQRFVEQDNIDKERIPDIPPGMLSEIIGDTDPQSQ